MTFPLGSLRPAGADSTLPTRDSKAVSSRRRPADEPEAGTSQRPTHWQRQALVLAGGVVWLLVLIALLTHSASDAAFSTSGSGEPVRNRAGVLGAWLSDLALFLVGFSVWWAMAIALHRWLRALAELLRSEDSTASASPAASASASALTSASTSAHSSMSARASASGAASISAAASGSAAPSESSAASATASGTASSSAVASATPAASASVAASEVPSASASATHLPVRKPLWVPSSASRSSSVAFMSAVAAASGARAVAPTMASYCARHGKSDMNSRPTSTRSERCAAAQAGAASSSSFHAQASGAGAKPGLTTGLFQLECAMGIATPQ